MGISGMDLGDLHKVWEIKALKKKAGEDEARRVLERVAKQVQPIMRRRKWRVKVLSEFCPANPALLGLNVGGGVHVKLRLRRPNRDWDFIPFEAVLDTMLHELCHIEHGPHNSLFYKLWDDIRKECEELMAKGITGTGQGFDLPGRCLGGFSRQPPLSSLRKTALAAAEKRAQIAALLPPGAKRLGGDKNIMTALTPVQAAAMAAERRMQDELWCGSTSFGASDGDSNDTQENFASKESAEILKSSSFSGNDVQHAMSGGKGGVLGDSHNYMKGLKRSRADSHISSSECSSEGKSIRTSTSGSLFDHSGIDNIEDQAVWECSICTLFNQPLALVCEACGVEKPKDVGFKFKIWSCKFCTLENNVKLEKCAACGQWRYSYGPPVSTRAPNVGT